MHDSTQKIIDEMDTLLEEERKALLKGDLESIRVLLARKEALIDELNALALNAQDLKHLQRKVLRNQALLDGALQGIRTVAGRLTALRRIRRTLETYDGRGQKSTILDVIEHQVERRA
ncbi:flagellar protein FlgN [Roseovarius sp. S4756]|uniref:flagellar protein FlgN n=1 Tax=Roseovarius maritimus TaxID=3342637 RepID=UPI00372770A1